MEFSAEAEWSALTKGLPFPDLTTQPGTKPERATCFVSLRTATANEIRKISFVKKNILQKSVQVLSELVTQPAFHTNMSIVSFTGISNKTLSLFSSKLASYVRILVQISSLYRQLKSAKKYL